MKPLIASYAKLKLHEGDFFMIQKIARFMIASLVVLIMFISGFPASPDQHDLLTPIFQGTEVVFFTPWPVFSETLFNYVEPGKIFKQNLRNVTWNIDQINVQFANLDWTLVTDLIASSRNYKEFQLKSKKLNLTMQS